MFKDLYSSAANPHRGDHNHCKRELNDGFNADGSMTNNGKAILTISIYRK